MGKGHKSMKVALDCLGCKLNQAETELLARQFTEAGYELVSLSGRPDVYVLNTCTVTGTADQKSRQRLRLAHRRNPAALVVAAGCYAGRAPEELLQIEGIDLVVGNDRKFELLELVEKTLGIAASSGTTDFINAGRNGFRSRCGDRKPVVSSNLPILLSNNTAMIFPARANGGVIVGTRFWLHGQPISPK